MRVAASRRLRYVVLLALAVIWAAHYLYAHGERLSDWLPFEIAARTFIHFQHNPVYDGNPLGLYARNPLIQIGPPAWLPLTVFQWASPWHVNFGFAMLMVLLGFGAVLSIEGISRLVRVEMTPMRRASMMLVVGGAVMIVWGYNIGRWHHLDDVMAITFTVFACALIQRQRAWWLVGLLLGTAIAAKPWAMILAPVLFGMSREDRSKATLAMIAVAAAWWAPFVLGASGTIESLGSYSIRVLPGSTWWLFGLHGNDIHRWLRPVQFIGGIVLAIAIARRSPNGWLAAPLGALAFRVLTDPFMWSYYGMGPVMFAFLWDMTRPGRWSRLPLYSAATLFVEGLLPWLPVRAPFGSFDDWVHVVEVAKVVWGVGILMALWLELRHPRRDEIGVGEPAPA